MPFIAGEMIGPYQLMEQLGQGGMATVYKAYHTTLDHFVAIKALHPAFMEDANFLARFQREARLVAKLDHPNIVPVYDFSAYEGRPYLVMKYIAGDTLKAVLQKEALQKRRLSSDQIARIVEAVGAALSYAHGQGILHRDVKPSNVLVTPEGMIYLADFGLARIGQAGNSTLTTDMLIVTPQYISPEQALSQTNLDNRTDVYSFGVMLYEMVVGRVPFSSDTPFAIIHDHIYTPLPLPSVINPFVSQAVEKVLVKALAKDRNERYVSIDQMVMEFVTALRSSSPASETVVVSIPEPALDETSVAPASRPSIEILDLIGAPSFTPPEMEEAAAEVSLEQEPLTSIPVKKKKGLPWWAVGLLVLVGVSLCILVWGISRNIIGRASGILPADTAMPTGAGTPDGLNSTIPPTIQEAWNTAMNAKLLWQNKNYLAADALFGRVIRQGEITALFLHRWAPQWRPINYGRWRR